MASKGNNQPNKLAWRNVSVGMMCCGWPKRWRIELSSLSKVIVGALILPSTQDNARRPLEDGFGILGAPESMFITLDWNRYAFVCSHRFISNRRPLCR